MLALLLLLVPCLVFAQPDTTWSRNFQINDRCYLYDVCYTPDDVLIGCGYASTGSLTTANQDFLIAAYSMTGDSLFVRTYEQTENDEVLEGITCAGEDTIVAVGYSGGGYSVDVLAFRMSTGDLLWRRTFTPGGGLSKGRDIVRLADGRLAVVGYRSRTNAGSDAWVLLCETNGDTVWTRMFGFNSTDIGNTLLQLPGGNLIIGGITRSSQTSPYDQWVFEVDLNGNQIGAGSTYGTEDQDFCYNVVRDHADAIWLLGRGGADNASFGYATVLPESGPTQSFEFSSPGYADQFRAGIPWFDGMLFVGRSGANGSTTGAFMRAIDENRASVWAWRFGATAYEGGLNNLVALPDGGAVICGTWVSPDDTNDVRGHLLRISPPAGVHGTVRGLSDNEPIEGARVHIAGESRYTLTNSDGEYRLEATPGSRDIVVEGDCVESDTSFGVQVVLNELALADFTPGQPQTAPLVSSINVIAQNQIEGGAIMLIENTGTGALQFSAEVEALDPPGDWISVSPASGIIAPGASAELFVTVLAETTDTGVFEFYGELRLHSNDCPDTLAAIPVLVSVLDAPEHAALPAAFSLSPAYPNPFNSQTNVILELPAETVLRLEMFNVQGRHVQTLLYDRLPAGNHNINIDLTGQSSGLYLLRAESPTGIATRKLLFLR